MKITKEYFNKELISFWEIMGNKSYTIEQVARALRGLITCYLQFAMYSKNQEERDSAEISMQAACGEHDRRLAYRIMLNI